MLAIPMAKMSLWYACREGDLQWQSLTDVADFYDHANKIRHTATPTEEVTETATASGVTNGPPAPKKSKSKAGPRRPLFEEPAEPTKTDRTLTVETTNVKERRVARRFVRNLKFAMANGSDKFECVTLDVSMAGLSLKDDLPADTPKSFRAELRLNDGRVKILCNRISDRSAKILEADSWDLLRQWIMSW
jgi:hypothetical protein